jgi:hypothetical protein
MFYLIIILIFKILEVKSDSAINMRGEWNDLQALFIKDYPYTCYIHCLAHQL